MIQTQREPVRLLNLQLQYAAIRDEVMAAVERVIDSQYFILGAEVERFEEEAAAYLKTAFAVGCASGSDAIMLALAAAGIKPT